jgi:pyruvate ferredoxin oxidoreductase delta subunit
MSLPGWKQLPIGAVILTPGNSVEYKTGEWRTLRPEIDQDKCIRCRTCWMYCPEGAIQEVDEPYKTKTGREFKLTYKVDYDYCKGCGICANECPVKAITMVEEVV